MSRVLIRPYTNSLQFNGTTSELIKATPTGINTGTDPISFAAWTYLDSDQLGTAMDLKSATQSRRFLMGNLAGTYYIFSDALNGGNNLTLSKAQFDGLRPLQRWMRVVWSLSSTVLTLYVDGVLIKAATLGVSMNSGVYSQLLLGEGDASGSKLQWVKGKMLDSYIVNALMSLSDAQNDYFNARRPTWVASAWALDTTSPVDTVGTNNLTGSNVSTVAMTPTKSRSNVSTRLIAVPRSAATVRSAA